MDFKLKEQLIRGLFFFIAGMVGLLYSISMNYVEDLYLIANILISLIGLIPGTIFITLSLTGKVQKGAQYPRISRKILVIVISTFMVLGTILLIFSLHQNFTPIIMPLFFSIICWGVVIHITWYFFNQNEKDSS